MCAGNNIIKIQIKNRKKKLALCQALCPLPMNERKHVARTKIPEFQIHDMDGWLPTCGKFFLTGAKASVKSNNFYLLGYRFI